MHVRWSFAALAVAALAVFSGEASAQSREFYCEDARVLTLNVVDATTISAGLTNGSTRQLTQDRHRAMTYVAGKVSVEIARNQRAVRIMQEGGEDINCLYPIPASVGGRGDDETVEVRDLPAKSWGGVVRAGPGMEFDKLASLAEGDRITLMEDSGVEMNGYNWFKIRYGSNQTGFQWGGIICPVGRPLLGTFQQCD